MTKKDYLLIAKAFKESEPPKPETYKYVSDASIQAEYVHNQWMDDVNIITAYLAEENSKFDGGRFLIACGIQD